MNVAAVVIVLLLRTKGSIGIVEPLHLRWSSNHNDERDGGVYGSTPQEDKSYR